MNKITETEKQKTVERLIVLSNKWISDDQMKEKMKKDIKGVLHEYAVNVDALDPELRKSVLTTEYFTRYEAADRLGRKLMTLAEALEKDRALRGALEKDPIPVLEKFGINANKLPSTILEAVSGAGFYSSLGRALNVPTGITGAGGAAPIGGAGPAASAGGITVSSVPSPGVAVTSAVTGNTTLEQLNASFGIPSVGKI